MKVAILALFACVAVSQAAFTANLVQRAQPALKQALFKVRLASGRSDLQTTLGQTLEAHANELLANIQNAVTTGQAIATGVVTELQNTWAAMQAVGSNVVSSGQEILSNLLGSLSGMFGGLFGRQKSLGAIVDFVQNFDLQATIDNLLAYATNLVSQINVPALLQSAVSALFNQLTGRGIFSNIFETISEHAGNAWEAIQGLFGQVTSVAGDAFNAVHAMASEFVSEAATNIHAITSEAATDFLNFLRPYQQDLGSLYDQVVAAVGQIGKN